MSNSPKELEIKFLSEIEKACSLPEIELLERQYLGRKGKFNDLFDSLQKLSGEERQKFGKEINSAKINVQAVCSQKKSDLENQKLLKTSNPANMDWSLPSYPFNLGRQHPLTQILDEVVEVFQGLGFGIAEGPEIETDENNFGSLNIPPDHPARDMHDTFYIDSEPETLNSKLLLRTHTSPVQIRVMKEVKPPIRIIAPGRVYRHEAIDATHSSVFHQVEGLAVDRDLSFADLKGTLELFSRRFFGKNIQTRFRPSYFPFVEPGAEVDISCTLCRSEKTKQGSKPCPVCKGKGWVEMLGAGMVHPNVFAAVGYDPEEFTGFAFGIGIERIAMVRYGINDMRLFYENHLDFLSQF